MKWFHKHSQKLGPMILYAAGFLLFIEWLRPLEDITTTTQVRVFTIFAAFCFLLSFFQMPFVVAFLLKLSGVLFIMHLMYFQAAPLFTFDWIAFMLNDSWQNLQSITQGQWWEMTSIFRSLLFFVLLWLMSYLMYYWVIQIHRLFSFFLLTILYLGVVDTFTVYDASVAIVRAFLIGFLAVGLLFMLRLRHRDGTYYKTSSLIKRAVLPLVVLILFSGAVGYLAPKAAPQWPDPVPFIQSAANGMNGNGSGVKRVGYGENDSQLGGPFVGDSGPVFRAVGEEFSYWRVESKDFYTGKGWETSIDSPYHRTSQDAVDLQMIDPSVEKAEQQVDIIMDESTAFPHLVYPTELRAVQTETPIELNINRFTGKILSTKDGQQNVLMRYTLQYDAPQFEKAALESVPTAGDQSMPIYTQLPEELPQRVSDLTQEITQGATNRLEQVEAIERYFSENGFEYNTQDVAVPGEDEDYVDQFLFDTQRGYCDNFSTSMVVMLRTLDIPARWVKGFTQGTYEETTSDGNLVYEVTNENAHSWVEVYFPGSGWVPFEPTRGFAGPSQYEEEVTEGPDFQPAEEEEAETPEEETETPEEEVQDESEEASVAPAGGGPTINWALVGQVLGWIGIVLLAVILIAVWITRRKWFIKYIVWKYKKREDEAAFTDAYDRLLRVLQSTGLTRQSGQTLRAYAKHVDTSLGNNDMSTLTDVYERALYFPSGSSSKENWGRYVGLWENLIRRILS
ncbi:transglutaminase TgpA family protein [Aureibacillus halotolerans]|uniref:Uncharacterized protein DUF4129 n=1 Tax=Aureibacillus halotolerans TaxID=1508390 RepID=A0A4R6TWQ5_9BACI|nr:transglutaminase domain-containing protein [Aureibacillus halotolerans]TDQ36275.1 uncharacterized protein DUF4129 [Aureibacillus halotolerans]